MIRPEVIALFTRWHEVLAGAALATLGLWTALSPLPVITALGVALAAAGAGVALVGLRRLRFAATGTGPGIVQLVEGQIAYFGPESGGFMALDDLAEIGLTSGAEAWLLRDVTGQRLTIPRAATGADALFDAFARLEGIDMAAVLRNIDAGGAAPVARIVWRRKARPLLT